jgi:pimeloyl-ACP methyl ester carboxylesterase
MNDRLSTVRSADGTTIAYEEFGSGPPLVLVHGSVSDRTYWAPVLPALAERFTVVCLDRRGRAASGDAPTYSVDLEFDDVAAVVDALEQPAHLVGHSYAGICALGATLRTHNLRTLTLYEPALGFDGPDGIPAEFIDQLDALVATPRQGGGRAGAAVRLGVYRGRGKPRVRRRCDQLPQRGAAHTGSAAAWSVAVVTDATAERSGLAPRPASRSPADGDPSTGELRKHCRDDRIRTCDPLTPRVVDDGC